MQQSPVSSQLSGCSHTTDRGLTGSNVHQSQFWTPEARGQRSGMAGPARTGGSHSLYARVRAAPGLGVRTLSIHQGFLPQNLLQPGHPKGHLLSGWPGGRTQRTVPSRGDRASAG